MKNLILINKSLFIFFKGRLVLIRKEVFKSMSRWKSIFRDAIADTINSYLESNYIFDESTCLSYIESQGGTLLDSDKSQKYLDLLKSNQCDELVKCLLESE